MCPRDVSDAGESVAAVLAGMLAMGVGFEPAVRAAIAAAAVVVGKPGTATVPVTELRSRALPAALRASEEKIVLDWSVLDEGLERCVARAGASASPMAALICCIPVTSRW
jgi:D-beta-D-heptose 7-phosphate kinase/D-beta-D-heptose 1-phosphate adenosyltransferase